jgi:hypothetical protein
VRSGFASLLSEALAVVSRASQLESGEAHAQLIDRTLESLVRTLQVAPRHWYIFRVLIVFGS